MSYPTENQYIDIHTHTAWNYPHIFSIRNLVKPLEIESYQPSATPISIGLHPWFIEPGKEHKLIDLVLEASSQTNVFAIGECGIDLKIETQYGLQEKIFLKHAAIAEESKKPLIIHCVKAYQQLTNLLKQQKPQIPWIFHGFNNTEQVALELINHGAYLSIGADLLKENSKIRRSLASLPLDHIFLETDEWQQPIWKLYAEAVKLLGITEKILKQQLFDNFRKCFPEQQDSGS
jgi:TatD DNase family protein